LTLKRAPPPPTERPVVIPRLPAERFTRRPGIILMLFRNRKPMAISSLRTLQ
jgi:hypothetical protein